MTLNNNIKYYVNKNYLEIYLHDRDTLLRINHPNMDKYWDFLFSDVDMRELNLDNDELRFLSQLAQCLNKYNVIKKL